jgi:hypothetical protein
MRLGEEKPQLHKFIPVLSHGMATDSMSIQEANPDDPVSFYPLMNHPMLITMYKSDTDEDMVTAPVSLEVQIAK